MSASQSPRPMYLQIAGTSVFAVLHMGVGLRRDTAVLLCPQFGWEDMLTYRTRRNGLKTWRGAVTRPCESISPAAATAPAFRPIQVSCRPGRRLWMEPCDGCGNMAAVMMSQRVWHRWR